MPIVRDPTLVEQMTKRLCAQPTFESAATAVLHDITSFLGATCGVVQLAAAEGLVLAAHKGFKAPLLKAIRKVCPEAGWACAWALRTRHIVVVSDTEADEEFAAYRQSARDAGFRSVTITPLLTRRGALVGAVCAYFPNVHEPTTIEIHTLQSYSVVAADYLSELLAGEPLEAKALAMNRQLYESLP